MTIKFPRLTLREIALFWAKEDADGTEIIEQRRLAEITELLRDAWRSGALPTSLTTDMAQPAQDWLSNAAMLASGSGDLAADQARKTLGVIHWQIDESQVDRRDFEAWLASRNISPPAFWSAAPTPDRQSAMSPTTSQAPDTGRRWNTGPRPFKAERARTRMQAALLSGELSIETLHNAPMKFIADQFGISRPTATPIVEALRKENPL